MSASVHPSTLPDTARVMPLKIGFGGIVDLMMSDNSDVCSCWYDSNETQGIAWQKAKSKRWIEEEEKEVEAGIEEIFWELDTSWVGCNRVNVMERMGKKQGLQEV